MKPVMVLLMLWASTCLALHVGTARVNITPQPGVGVPMVGYTAIHDMLSHGVHDSLYARILVLDDGKRQVCLAALDLIGLNTGHLPGMLRDLGLEGWLLVSTHTHGGPMVLQLETPYGEDRTWPTGAPYLTWLEAQIVDGVRQAQNRLQPVQVSVGWAQADLSFNRRLVKPDGTVEMIWGQNRTRRKLGPTDPEVGVVCFSGEDDKPLALLVNYACHAVVLGSDNRLLTADFPGYTAAYLERQFPGAIALFLQGAAGDLDPYIDVQNDFAPAREQGEELGRQVEGAIRGLVPFQEGGARSLESDAQLELIELSRPFHRYGDQTQSVVVHFSVLSLGRRLALVGLPGEPFVELQMDLKARSLVPFTFMLGYTNGYAGYFPTQQANREGGYGASFGGTLHLEASAGKTMVADALEVLAGLAPSVPSVVSETPSTPPLPFFLEQNHPNPFNQGTTIHFVLSARTQVELAVFNLEGQKVITLLNAVREIGRYQVIWDGRDEKGKLVSSGIYFCRLVSTGLVETRRMLLLE